MASTTWTQDAGMDSDTTASEVQSFLDQAEQAKTDAEGYAADASQARTLAEQAQAAAETAETGSVAARNASQAAETAAAAAQTASENARDAAQTAQSAAESAETAAAGSEAAAGNSETAAAASESAAAASASAAATSESNAAAAFDSFDDRYLGSKVSAPATDNDGDPLVEGALYWNSTSNNLFIWDGASWAAAAFDTANPSFSSANVTGNVTVGGTVDGRDVGADGSKLDGIEAGATADQTAAEIKTAYESNADTNAFTDAEQSKLSGIETGADVTDTTNVTAAGALMDSELTNISAVKGLDQGVATTDSPSFAGLTATTADINGGTIDGATVDGRDVGADGSKLDGIESGADVTDTANVTAAGAAMTANNLSDLADASAARTALGVAIGTDVQAFNAALADIAGITFSQGDILYHDGSDIVRLGIGTADQVLTVNTGATAPEWADASGGSSISQATKSALESETDEDTYAPPDLIKHTPGAAKASYEYDQVTPSLVRENNISSVTDNGTGDYTINFTNNFSAADQIVLSGVLVTFGSNRGLAAAGIKSNSTLDLDSGIRTTSDINMGYGAASSESVAGAQFDREYNSAAIMGGLA